MSRYRPTYRRAHQYGRAHQRPALSPCSRVRLESANARRRYPRACPSRWRCFLSCPAPPSRRSPDGSPVRLDTDSACLNDYKYGSTRIVQCASGVPTTTQIAFNTHGNSDPWTTAPAPNSWISIQDHGVSLVPIDSSEPTGGWAKPTSYFSSTNWGGNVGDLMAQAHGTWYGDKDPQGEQGTDAVRSGMSYGYVSYTPKEKDNLTLGANQFFVSGGGSTLYYLNGCPNYFPGNTAANRNTTALASRSSPAATSSPSWACCSAVWSTAQCSYPDYAHRARRTTATWRSTSRRAHLHAGRDQRRRRERQVCVGRVPRRHDGELHGPHEHHRHRGHEAALRVARLGRGRDRLKVLRYYSTGSMRDTAAIETGFGAIPATCRTAWMAASATTPGSATRPTASPWAPTPGEENGQGRHGRDAQH